MGVDSAWWCQERLPRGIALRLDPVWWGATLQLLWAAGRGFRGRKEGLEMSKCQELVNAWCIREQVQWQTRSVCGRLGVPGIEPGRVSSGQMWKPPRPRSCHFVLDRTVIQENGSPEIILVVFSSSCLSFRTEMFVPTQNRRASQHQTSSPGLSVTMIFMPDATSREATQPRNWMSALSM